MAIYGFGRDHAAQLVKVARREGLRQSSAGSASFPETGAERNYAVVRFKNSAGEAAPGYGLLRVTGMASEDDLKIITIAKPNGSFIRDGYMVNGPDEVADGGYGWGTWLWHADYVLYDTGNTPAYGETWGPQNNTWTIKKNHPGFYIMGGNTGTGATSRTIALQSIPEMVLGKADSAIANAASGTVRVYGGTQGSESDTGLTIASCYNYGPDIADEAVVSVGWLSGKPYVANMSCPE